MGIILNRSKNLIINGAMDYWQRALSFVSPSSSTYLADRFEQSKVGSFAHTISRDTDVPSIIEAKYQFPYSMKLVLTTPQDVLAAGDRCTIWQKLEGNTLSPEAGKKLTLSFWVKATLTGIYSVSFRNGAADRSLVRNFEINSSNTWEKKIITITHDTSGTWDYSTGIGMYVGFNLAMGSTYHAPQEDSWLNGNYQGLATQVNGVQTGATNFLVTGIMLNPGEQASGFSRAGGDVVNELILCQRYYEKSYNLDTIPGTATVTGEMYMFKGSPSTSARGGVRFATRKRVAPSIVAYSPITGAANIVRNDASEVGAVYSNVGEAGYVQDKTGASDTSQSLVQFHYTADAEL